MHFPKSFQNRTAIIPKSFRYWLEPKPPPCKDLICCEALLRIEVRQAMPRATPSKKDFAEFRKMMDDVETARLERFSANAPKYAEVLGTFRAALQKSGFSADESMQVVLKVLEQPSRRRMFGGGRGGHWR